MKKSKYTEEQIIGFLKQAEAGVAVKELCRKHGFSDAAGLDPVSRTHWGLILKRS
jgi:putative transposase